MWYIGNALESELSNPVVKQIQLLTSQSRSMRPGDIGLSNGFNINSRSMFAKR